jgi:hypothetical protein
MGHQKITRFLVYSTLVLLFLPMLQIFFGFQKVVKLNGVVEEEVEDLEWYWDSWFNGDYQKKIDVFHKSNFGFREALIRMNNDRVYTWFNESTNSEVIIGKENYLFSKKYIDEYVGNHYLGRMVLKEKVDYLKAISEGCKKQGKVFLLVLAPNKAAYYSEHIPYKHEIGDSINSVVFLSELEAQGLNVFDVNTWFLEKKKTTNYPLFPKGGVHWSHYGVSVFIDSLLTNLEEDLGKDLPELLIDTLWASDSLLSPDNDLELLLNLNQPIAMREPHAYVRGHYTVRGKYQPKVITIGDSFWGTFYFLNYLSKDCFSNDSEYWYYNHTVFPGGKKRVKKDLHKFDNSDVVMMVLTSCNLRHFGWGALSELREYFSLTDEMLINQIIKEMKASPKWYNDLKNKGLQQNIPLDTILYKDAAYIIKQRQLK